MRTVLVIDDDATVRRAIRRAVIQDGYDVHACATAEEGIEYVQTHPPPCFVLLDLNLPGMSGIEFLRWTREEQRLRGIPVAVISASSHLFADLASFRDDVLVRVFEKPFDLGDLLETLTVDCGSARSRSPGSRSTVGPHR